MILHFLLDELPERASSAMALFESAEQGEVILSIESIIVAECSDVLQGKNFNLDKHLIASSLVPVLVRK